MTLKYLFRASLVTTVMALFSSCLNSTDSVTTYSPDAQIYSFSLSSRADSNGLLPSTVFSIDQINNKIFNKTTLPYRFSVDSVRISITGSSTYSSFSRVMLRLSPDSTIAWSATDSVAVGRLQQIITTSANGENVKTYDFQLNIYSEDPYTLSWENKSRNYIAPSPETQKTIILNKRFFTYHGSGGALHVTTSPIIDGVTWTAAALQGLPQTVRLSSLFSADNNTAYVLDEDDKLYASTDGTNWSQKATAYPVAAIYGNLPLATKGDMLIAVNDNNTLKFAETSDFSTITVMNDLPSGMPTKDFSAAKEDNPNVYARKDIILVGGQTADNTLNNRLWILKEKDGVITTMPVTSSIPLQGSSVFAYDNALYLLTVSSGKNILMRSESSGLNWNAADENQALPDAFTYRTNPSVIVASDNYIWIFGGISATSTQIADAWAGRLNKYGNN